MTSAVQAAPRPQRKKVWELSTNLNRSGRWANFKAMSQLVVAQLYSGQISPHRSLCRERPNLSPPHSATGTTDTQPAASATELFPTGRYGRGGQAARRALTHLLPALPGHAAQALGFKPQLASLPLCPMQAYLQSVDRNTAGPPA